MDRLSDDLQKAQSLNSQQLTADYLHEKCPKDKSIDDACIARALPKLLDRSLNDDALNTISLAGHIADSSKVGDFAERARKQLEADYKREQALSSSSATPVPTTVDGSTDNPARAIAH